MSAYIYADTAIGGVNRRNNVINVETFSPNGDPDVFATVCRFTSDLVEYTRTNLNEHGKPSVSAYPGPAFATFIPLDFDDEDDPGRALEDLRATLLHLEGVHEIPRDAVRLFFSGHKGFSAEIPLSLFGPVGPS